MRPVVTVAEMRAADERALARVAQSVLVQRAGTAVAAAARRMLGQVYGSRVVVVAGKGNNGADGRVAAALLRQRGAKVMVLDPSGGPGEGGGPGDGRRDAGGRLLLPPCDLVIDAAYGTGFRGAYSPPAVPPGAAVLAVDIPSGVAGDSGEVAGEAVVADRTVTMAALKTGLLQGAGPEHSGVVEVADIGIPVGSPSVALMEDRDAHRLPARPRQSHKWAGAVAVVAGSPGMEGAAVLASLGAMRAGAGMVRLCVPGSELPGGGALGGPWPLEAVRVVLPGEGWAGTVLAVLERCKALVIGPGLGRLEPTRAEVRRLLAESPVPVVADADALVALGRAEEAAGVIGGRPVVLTPHDGEFAGLAGGAPGGDRIGAASRLAGATGVTVLLKGPLTAVASPAGGSAAAGAGTPPGGLPAVLLSASGSPRLATAGTGDVLSGMIGAFVARGLPVAEAAALAAHVHGRAAASGRSVGLGAGDLPDLVSDWLSAATGSAAESGDGDGAGGRQ